MTGATGFIGRSLCRALAAQGYTVWGVRRPASRIDGAPSVTWISCDLSKPIDFGEWPTEIDAIVHLAQSLRFREFPEGARDVFDVNVRSTFDLLEYGRKVGIKHFLHASTGGIYGRSDREFVEADVIKLARPLDFYLTSKYAAELLVENYARHFSGAILRCFFVYGPGQRADMLIPRLINSVREGLPVTLQGKDGLRVNPIFISDAIDVFSRVLEHQQDIKLNVAGAEILNLRKIGEIIGGAIRRPPVFESRPAQESISLVGDINSLSTTLEFEPQVSFAEGVTQLLRYEDRA